ncbi:MULTISPECIES: MarR family winged helix-turn-helix transcriptional regulator [Sphingobacterium]|jgi:DNA-binding MarR family transcriptional regulator|uniref:MarR family transcriptional regulator n=1 Tax=Sphingobacterium paramultivorum TaxID=2886510 RepID=A0A7G5DWT8_9SPHI|nr:MULTISPECIES: helix-turn-helix domain-containing protein [Sphingobacterium]MBB1646674.1 MarR family transcriptional regulator [Sphingobacterium sp. UME9]QMV66213.1 MarR family transcriptional regulator [Sphingobacterium paramultivorum]WET66986.1 MAG: helix-turn-helix domain-containing protein [Sphingobacterium sp.]WSO14989.1 helix-turn-helix domain-containing protein [Sphingobacterium paramultivorum]
MKYQLLKEIIVLVEEFEQENVDGIYSTDADGFKRWIVTKETDVLVEPNWDGKENGRSPESVISTLIVHMNRFAKSYSKAAIWESDFSTQEEFIYLITLRSFGEMTKMELIRRNIHEKPAGMAIINRLIKQRWIGQQDSKLDRRSKVLYITEDGLSALDRQMGKIRHATQIVSGDLTYSEKITLISLLDKLSKFHQLIYDRNISPEKLLEQVKL